MARISITEDTTHGPGWASIRVSPKPAKADAGIVILRRQSDKPYLGPSGWQSQKHSLVPDDTLHEEAAITFLFGPEVTRHLLVDQDIDVLVEGTSIQERHFWPEIMGSQPVVAGTVGRAPQKETTKVLGSGPGTGTSQPIEEPPTEEPPSEDPPEEPENTGEDIAERPPTAEEPPRSRRWMAYAGAAGLAIVIAAAAFMFPWGGLPPAEQQDPEPAPADDTSTTPTEPEPQPPPPPAESLAQRYETYRTAGGHAGELYQLYTEAMDADEIAVAEKAIVLSASRGSAEANVLMGRWKDPGAIRHRFSDPQPAAALRYYCRAIGLGSDEAGQLLDALRARAEAPPAEEIRLFEHFPEACPAEQP